MHDFEQANLPKVLKEALQELNWAYGRGEISQIEYSIEGYGGPDGGTAENGHGKVVCKKQFGTETISWKVLHRTLYFRGHQKKLEFPPFGIFEVIRPISNFYGREALQQVLEQMSIGNTLIFRIGQFDETKGYQKEKNSPSVEVVRTAEGWEIEESIPQKTVDDALKCLFGFFGEYKPL